MAATLLGLPPGGDTEKAAVNVAEAWATSEPRAALPWAAGQTDAGLREKTPEPPSRPGRARTPGAPRSGFDALPEGGERDIAAHHLARVLRHDEPESAWT